MKNIPVCKIVASPLSRARETAEILHTHLSIPLHIDERVREHAPSRTLRGRYFKEAKKQTRKNYDFVPKDGESLNQSVERFLASIIEHAQSCGDGSGLCIISHALVIQNTLIKLFSLDAPPSIDEVSITALSYNNGKFELVYINNPPSTWLALSGKIRKKIKYWGKESGLWD